MLGSWLWILGMGFFVGQILGRLGMPPLVGMILVGILLQEVLSPELLAAAGDLRLVAVTIILMKAGLGLDREKLAQQGSVALRLGFLPAACEALAVALLSRWILGLDWATGLLLGCVIGAESPAVIVPGMLRLKSLGWGVAKGIPDAILTGSALSDVLLLLGFSLLLSFLGQGSPRGPSPVRPGAVAAAVAAVPGGDGDPAGGGHRLPGGAAFGGAPGAAELDAQQHARGVAGSLPGAGPGVGVAGVALFFRLPGGDGPGVFSRPTGWAAGAAAAAWVRRPLDGGGDRAVCLLGASLDLQVLGSLLLPGLLLLTLSLLLGRGLGWWLSTVGSNWNWRERLFLLPGNMAKATVQAAIGGIPLAQGIPGGETILAIAALSILATAPLGAWLTQVFAPRLLEKGEVDPTKVGSQGKVSFLAAVDTSPLAEAVLRKAADLARRLDGEVIVLHVTDEPQGKRVEQLRQLAQRLLADIRHEFCLASGPLAETIVGLAQERQVTDIVMGKRGQRGWEQVLLGSTSQAVLETSPIPVILVEEEEFGKARIDTPTA